MSHQNPPAGWHVDPHVRGQQRYWDGQAWTAQVRPLIPTPPAGWYVDPRVPGQQRYWDGQAWTAHVRPLGPNPPSSQQGKPWYEKKRFVIPIAVAGLIALGAAGGASGGATDDVVTDTAKPSASDQAEKGTKEKAQEDTDAAERTAQEAAEAAKEAEKKEAAKKKEAEKKEAAKPISVDAATLIKAFEDNEFAADAKYKGKTLRITGNLRKIETELFDDSDYTLLLDGGGEYEFEHVTAYDVPNKDIAKLATGEKVTVVCKFKDGDDLGVTVNKCELG
ncbi:DUF2510 domain-containing protein [Mumia sp. zg.B53]|uniref:DUF2510 domain-containing protein n=1 Tax=Mumia sp. zg.B53 TaxID=2855449 RepID=UPI001C6E6628|nr:DUF2510 domain-containing protein [Mumia sp. zg.B53]MBW9214337.1 DUF2510 domain-containing protein [Mumia sp. zg.B53]